MLRLERINTKQKKRPAQVLRRRVLMIFHSLVYYSVMPPTTKPSPSSSSTVSSPASVSYSTEEPVVKQQSGQDDSKPNYGIILGAVFGVVGFIAIVFNIILLIIARRKRSPKLE